MLNKTKSILSDRQFSALLFIKGENRNMKEIETRKAVGHVLCHDITQIIKDEKK